MGERVDLFSGAIDDGKLSEILRSPLSNLIRQQVQHNVMVVELSQALEIQSQLQQKLNFLSKLRQRLHAVLDAAKQLSQHRQDERAFAHELSAEKDAQQIQEILQQRLEQAEHKLRLVTAEIDTMAQLLTEIDRDIAAYKQQQSQCYQELNHLPIVSAVPELFAENLNDPDMAEQILTTDVCVSEQEYVVAKELLTPTEDGNFLDDFREATGQMSLPHQLREAMAKLRHERPKGAPTLPKASESLQQALTLKEQLALVYATRQHQKRQQQVRQPQNRFAEDELTVPGEDTMPGLFQKAKSVYKVVQSYSQINEKAYQMKKAIFTKCDQQVATLAQKHHYVSTLLSEATNRYHVLSEEVDELKSSLEELTRSIGAPSPGQIDAYSRDQ